jgi:hypothetical protein
MFEDFIVTDHALKRYCQRVLHDDDEKEEVIRRIKRDLYFKKIKRIVNNGNTRHVFTWHSKEFIFVKDRNKWILKTVIKRTRAKNPKAIERRIRAAYAPAS